MVLSLKCFGGNCRVLISEQLNKTRISLSNEAKFQLVRCRVGERSQNVFHNRSEILKLMVIVQQLVIHHACNSISSTQYRRTRKVVSEHNTPPKNKPRT